MVYPEASLSSPAVETLTKIQQDNDGVSDRAPNLFTKLTDIILQVATQGDGHIALQVITLIANTSFEINISKPCIKGLANCKDITTTITKELMETMDCVRFRCKAVLQERTAAPR